MMVLVFIRLDPQRTVVEADFAQHAAIQECADVLVNRGQRNGRYLFSHAFVDQFRARMSVQLHPRFVDHSPLMGNTQTMLAAQSAKVAITYDCRMISI